MPPGRWRCRPPRIDSLGGSGAAVRLGTRVVAPAATGISVDDDPSMTASANGYPSHARLPLRAPAARSGSLPIAAAIPRLAIVGGGPGGLFTAYELQRIADRRIAVTIYEASDRLGGKVITNRFETADVRYEAGAAEFYEYEHLGHDPLKELIRELGLPIRPMGGPAVIVDGHVVANLDDVRDRLGADAERSLLDFDRRARDRMTPREFYRSGDVDVSPSAAGARRFDATLSEIDCPNARRYVEHLIHSDLAAEPSQTNEEFGLQNFLMNDPTYMRLYGIEGGNARLVEALAARIDAAVRPGRRVDSVERTQDGAMVVRSQGGDGVHAEEFDFVVVALPHAAVAKVSFLGDGLREAVAAHHAHHDHPAHYLRITMLFDRPFWRGSLSDSFWMLDRFGGCCLYDESSRDPSTSHGVLGWLLGGDAAKSLADADDATILSAAFDTLPPILSEARDRMLEARVHRWIGEVSALPGGSSPWPRDRRHCPDPIGHPHLFMVGDYLYDSTLNGVLDSAEHVAGWIAARVSDAARR